MPRDLLAEQPKNAGPRDLLAAPKKVWAADILPFSRDDAGNKDYFDTDAGIIGMAKRALTAGGDSWAGRIPQYGPDGHTSDEMLSRGNEAAAVALPVSPAARARGLMGGLRPATKDVNIPSPAELKAAGKQGFKDVRKMGVDYRVDAVKGFASTTRAHLDEDGLSDMVAPLTSRALDKLENPPPGSIASLSGLVTARHTLRNIISNATPKGPSGGNPSEVAAASRLIEAIDGFIAKPPPQGVLAGPASSAGKVLTDANRNYAASKRSQNLYDLEESATVRAAARNSGQNAEGLIRQRAADIIDPKKPHLRAGYSEGELELIRGVAMGEFKGKTLRWVGNFLGGGGGLGSMASFGVGAGVAGGLAGPLAGAAVGMTLPALGAAAKAGSRSIAKSALRKANEATRKRSALYEKRLAETPATAALDPIERALLLRAMAAQGLEQAR